MLAQTSPTPSRPSPAIVCNSAATAPAHPTRHAPAARVTLAAGALLLAAAIVTATHARAQEIGDARAGQAYAEKACSECHAVSPGAAASPNPSAPTFEAVAKSDGMTERALGVWFQTSHPTMPNLVIPPSDLDNVIAYIMSLKKGK